MRKVVLAGVCLLLLSSCTRVLVVGSLRPQLPVPEKIKVELPVEGLKKKQLTPQEIEQLVDVLYRTNGRAARMEATIRKYNETSARINSEIRKELGLSR